MSANTVEMQTIFRLTLHFLRYAAQKENNLQPFDSAFNSAISLFN